ncbi:MAG: hypothetical protein SPJ50_03410 [Ligilactobacillus salivarius]|nr:hypothetical protein [Ligilactobacillus salivarius]MDY5593195.1 hypothetical protein [Limosilactobacillus reuteri]
MKQLNKSNFWFLVAYCWSVLEFLKITLSLVGVRIKAHLNLKVLERVGVLKNSPTALTLTPARVLVTSVGAVGVFWTFSCLYKSN